MRKILPIILLFTCICCIAADMAFVCDEVTGVCRIIDPAQESAVAEESTIADSRTLIGMADVPEFMAFLKNESVSDMPDWGFWGMLIAALLGGIALNLTPCVLPMIPINLAIIGANGGRNGLRMGLLYGGGMAFAYGMLGILAAFFGVSFGALNSSPVFNFAAAAIFLLLALAMAGVVNIDLSSRFRVDARKWNFSKDFAALLMGGVSALLAGACVAPVVISVLVFTAGSVGSGNWYSIILPFALGAGMALPWPFAGFGMSVLPKPGRFMAVLKYVFSAVIFLAAVYYAAMGTMLLSDDADNGTPVGVSALAAAEKETAVSGKPILIQFTASWCKNCHTMEKTTLRDPEVAEYIRENFIRVILSADDPEQPEIKALLDKYGIPGFPAFVIAEY